MQDNYLETDFEIDEKYVGPSSNFNEFRPISSSRRNSVQKNLNDNEAVDAKYKNDWSPLPPIPNSELNGSLTPSFEEFFKSSNLNDGDNEINKQKPPVAKASSTETHFPPVTKVNRKLSITAQHILSSDDYDASVNTGTATNTNSKASTFHKSGRKLSSSGSQVSSYSSRFGIENLGNPDIDPLGLKSQKKIIPDIDSMYEVDLDLPSPDKPKVIIRRKSNSNLTNSNPLPVELLFYVKESTRKQVGEHKTSVESKNIITRNIYSREAKIERDMHLSKQKLNKNTQGIIIYFI